MFALGVLGRGSTLTVLVQPTFNIARTGRSTNKDFHSLFLLERLSLCVAATGPVKARCLGFSCDCMRRTPEIYLSEVRYICTLEFPLLRNLITCDCVTPGKNIKDVNPVDLRSRIAIAIQSPGMKMDCIRANCIYGSEKLFEETPDPEYMDRKIYEALVKLNSWSMFSDPNTFPEGTTRKPDRCARWHLHHRRWCVEPLQALIRTNGNSQEDKSV